MTMGLLRKLTEPKESHGSITRYECPACGGLYRSQAAADACCAGK